jgi:hypothetical protein
MAPARPVPSLRFIALQHGDIAAATVPPEPMKEIT